MFSGDSITRSAAIAALNAADRQWRIAFSSESLLSLVVALRSGFGVSAQTSLLAGPELEAVPRAAGLPLLQETEVIVLVRGRTRRGRLEPSWPIGAAGPSAGTRAAD